jgi:hypothetical protein
MKTRVQGASRAVRRQVDIFCCAEQLESRQLLAADLSGTFSGALPAALLPGGKNKLVLRLVNGGDADVSGTAVGVSLFASTNATLDGADISIASVTTKKLKLKAAGGGTNVNFAFASPTNVPDGNYFLIGQIDTGSVLAENSEDNNVASTSAIEIRQPFVDLSGTTEVTAGTISIAAGKKVKAPKVALVVGNSGNVAATGTVTATVFASTNTSAGDASDVQIGTVSKKLNTKPQKTTALKPKIAIPENLRTGNYNIVATFSYSGPITETNTANNSAASAAQITVDNPAFPAGATVGSLSVDATTFAVNSAEQVFFDVSITEIPAGDTLTADLIEVDAGGVVIGTRVAQLLDNGIATNNDATADDGIFSASTAIQFTATGDRFFKARVTNAASSATTDTPIVKLSGVAPLTEQDVQDTIATAGQRQAQLSATVGSGATTAAAIEATRQMLMTQPDVQTNSIQTGSNAIAYLNFKGILTYLSAKASALAPTFVGSQSAALVDSGTYDSRLLDCGCGDIVALAEGDALAACDRAIVLSPASASLQSLDPSPAIVNSLLNPVTSDPAFGSFNVASRFGADANVEAFKGLGQNKFISISGEAFSVSTYGVGIQTGQVATTLGNISNLADLASNRLAVGGSGNYVVTPKFFLHYNGDMDGAVVLANVDYSTEDVGFATSFLRRGAKAVAGFTGETSLEYGRNASAEFVENITNFVVAPTIAQAVATTIGVVGTGSVDSTFSFFGTGESKLEVGCDLLSENDLFIEYTWNQNVRDLDTSTEFLGDSVGFSCGAGNQFMTFTGDNTATGGSESVTINLKGAFDAGQVTTSTMVSASAGWFDNAGGTGPATLTVSLKNKTTGELSQTLSRTISPGTQGDCADTLVGNVTVTLTSEASPRVSIALV